MTEENKTEETSDEKNEQAIGITQTAAKLICEIIALCTKRGAFQANELTVVGALYDQLVAQLPAEMLTPEVPVAPESDQPEEKSEEQPELPLDDKK